MIKSKNQLKFFLEQDLRANNLLCSWWKRKMKQLCGSESANVVHWLIHFRRWEYHANNKGVYHRMASKYHEIRTKQLGLRFNLRAEINRIGYGLRIIHLAGGGGVYLNAEKIGNNCGFNSGSIIGVKDSINMRPTIGDNVIFGPGAKAFGKIEIGAGSYVAANAVVNTSFPEKSIIGGVPAKLLKTKKG